jgi:hypothetical protein
MIFWLVRGARIPVVIGLAFACAEAIPCWEKKASRCFSDLHPWEPPKGLHCGLASLPHLAAIMRLEPSGQISLRPWTPTQ